jgi:predicted Rossmann fold nucleotide-binding protein DprA/Smf involved in DNA uptake
MRTIIAGSRGLGNLALFQALDRCPWTSEITTVISGAARGIDESGELWARHKGKALERYPADWNSGRAAGYRRNLKMAGKAEALLAVWDGRSSGTKHMIDIATAKGLRVFVYTPSEAHAVGQS